MLEWSKAPISSYPSGTFPTVAQGMVLGAAFDPNVKSYPVLILMMEQGVLVGRGGVCPQSLGEAEPSPRGSGEAESSPRGSGKAESSPEPLGEAESSPRGLGEAESSPRGSGEAESSP